MSGFLRWRRVMAEIIPVNCSMDPDWSGERYS